MAEALAEISVADQIEAEIRAGNVELPVLPEVAVKVREIVAADGPLSAVGAAIEKEPAFAAAVLRYANSVAFKGLRTVVDLKEAMTRLGMKAVEQIITASAAQNAFKSADPRDNEIFRRLWDHSLTTAMAARRLAGRGVNAELAFLAGLLHDSGKVVVLRCVGELRERDAERFQFAPAVLNEFFDALHCRVGDLFMDSWNIPEEIRVVVRRHHDKQFDGTDDLLVATVSFADRIAAKLGASLNPDPNLSLLDSPAVTLLRLDDVKAASLLLDVEDDVATFGGGR
jgi:putative nucleotidyltransferase with HDIG domain